MAAAALLVCAPALPAQPEPLTVFEDTGLTGTFCETDEGSGDNPPAIFLKTDKGFFQLSSFILEMADYEKMIALKPGTPVIFDISVIYAFNESGGGMFTYTGIPVIRATGGASNASVCRQPGEPQALGFSADKAAGHFCGFVPGTGDVPDKVSVKNGKGIYSLTPRINGLEKLKALSDLAPGTPITYDATVVISDDGDAPGFKTPPVIAISNYTVAGDPVQGICGPAAQ
jgi:hypothetical protein